MAPLISFGWVVLGVIIILLKFGEEKLGGSIRNTAKLFLYPILFLMLVAACAKAEYPGFTLGSIGLGIFWGCLAAEAEKDVSKGVIFGLSYSMTAAFWCSLCVEVIWEFTWRSEFFSVAICVFGFVLAFYVSCCVIDLVSKPPEPEKPDYINWEEVEFPKKYTEDGDISHDPWK